MKRVIVKGVIEGNERGYGFLIPDGLEEDFFVSHGDLRGAMHKDEVLAEAVYDRGERTVARVLKVLKRGVTYVSGTYFSGRTGGFVTPDDRKYFSDVFVPFGKGLRAKSGDKVACKIVAYPKGKSPEGIITEIFGRQYNRHAELAALYYTFGLEDGFPSAVQKEAENIKEKFTDDDRKDFTDLITFTIDGEDAKDFDDAVSVSETANGYLLGVHIADVTHYVKENGAIDKEAFLRGTSVYFPEKVFPMLPEKLCNDLCSLKQGEKRNTLSCMIELDKRGNVVKSYVTQSCIKSKARLTYGDAQKILDGDKETALKYADIVPSLKTMSKLCDILVKKRAEKGSVDLDVKESVISVDKYGRIDVRASSQRKSERLIEEFMVLANVCVATAMYDAGVPFVYRVHAKLSEEKTETFFDFLSGIGITIERDREVTPKFFGQILELAENNRASTVVNRVMLRSMCKAEYSATDIGHFGLGEKHYCHFTSPIRRYPDLMIHRIIKEYLKKGKKDLSAQYGDKVKAVSFQSSLKERNAQDAERTVDDFYKVLYMSGYIGQEFDAVISGVTSFGLFAEMDDGIEGIIRAEKLRGYVFNEKSFSAKVGKKVYTLGAKVRIKVDNVDYGSRKIELSLCDNA